MSDDKMAEGVYADRCYNCDKHKRTLSNGLCAHCNAVLQTDDYLTNECKMCGRERSLNEQGYCSFMLDDMEFLAVK